MDRDTLLRRAAKLMQFQSGNATQAELELAAERLGALMREHNISLGEITAKELEAHIKQGRANSRYEQRAPAWYQSLAVWVARACSCRAIKYGPRYEFLGEACDVEVAVYFMNICSEALPFICDMQKPRDRKSFMWAAVEAVGVRLAKLVRPPEMSVSERGLIINKETAVNAEVERRWPSAKCHAPRVNMGNDAESYAMGTAAGNAMRLNHGLKSSAPNSLID